MILLALISKNRIFKPKDFKFVDHHTTKLLQESFPMMVFTVLGYHLYWVAFNKSVISRRLQMSLSNSGWTFSGFKLWPPTISKPVNPEKNLFIFKSLEKWLLKAIMKLEAGRKYLMEGSRYVLIKTVGLVFFLPKQLTIWARRHLYWELCVLWPKTIIRKSIDF